MLDTKDIEDDKLKEILYNLIKEGDHVLVKHHYAGYKSQYRYLFGTVIKKENVLLVKIILNPEDVEQKDEIQLECFMSIKRV